MAITDNAAHALPTGGTAAGTERPTHITGASQDSEIVRRAAREPEADTVWINEHPAVGSEMPHDRVKGSGS
jgi:hypothetical protein